MSNDSVERHITVTDGQKGNSQGSNQILPLTSLRFFAAFFVVLYHTCARDGLSWFGRVVNQGYVSVSFFFTLSGYILAVVYLRDRTQLDKKTFWVARFARVYPMFLLTLMLDTPFLLFVRIAKYGLASAIAKTTVNFLGCCLTLQSWFTALGAIDTPNWSLSAETVFYFVFPFVGAAIWRIYSSKTWFCAVLIYLCGIAALLGVSKMGMTVATVGFNPILHLHEFVAGILIAKIQNEFSPAQRGVVRGIAGFVSVVVALVFLVIAQVQTQNLYLLDGLLVPLYALVIWSFSSKNRFISLLFSRPWLVLLGEASYGVYLIHIPLFHIYEHLGLANGSNGIAYLAYLASTVGISVVAFRLFETPARRAILRKFLPKPSVPAAQAVMTTLAR